MSASVLRDEQERAAEARRLARLAAVLLERGQEALPPFIPLPHGRVVHAKDHEISTALALEAFRELRLRRIELGASVRVVGPDKLERAPVLQDDAVQPGPGGIFFDLAGQLRDVAPRWGCRTSLQLMYMDM